MEFFSPKRSIYLFTAALTSSNVMGYWNSGMLGYNEYFKFRMHPEPSATAASVD
jgi:hypothetical protein